jgi:transposase
MKTKKRILSRKTLGLMRIKAIRARQAGMPCKDIAKAFGVTPVSVSRWISKYRDHGARWLQPRKSSGRPNSIDCVELFTKLKKVVKRPATDFKFNSPLWTTKKLQRVLNQDLGLKISRATVWRSLRVIGLSCQKPERRAFEADEYFRKIWLKDFWPKLKKKAKKERAVILFEDEASVSLIPTLGKTWSKIGKTPIVKVTGKKGSVSVISAVSTTGKLYFTVPQDTVKSSEIIKFFKQILREIPRKIIYIILDGSTTHRSVATKKFVATQPRLRMIRFPSYSPDFNPDEFTWERLKTVEMNTHVETNITSLRAKTLGSMKSIQKKKKLLKGFFKRSKLT